MAKKALASLSPSPVPNVNLLPLERPASASIRRLLPSLSDSWLLPHYVVGPENEGLRYLFDDARIASLGSISPILLYGDKQLGKTALAITLALRWSQETKLRPLCFTTGSSFASDYASAVEIDDIASFRHRVRDSKMVVIDDIDAIAGKAAAQDELANTMDQLLEEGKPLVVTSSRLPALIKGLRPPLASRLVPGYSLGLSKPSPTTREHLVRHFVAALNPALPTDDLIRLVERLPGAASLNAYQLRDVVTVANQQANFGGPLDLEIVARLAHQLVRNEGPSVNDIAKVVARRMQVKLTELRSSARHANIVRARGMAVCLCRRMTSSSLQQIGEFFGGRDHSTVLHACRKAEQLLGSNPEFANLAREIQAELLAN